MVHSFDAAYSAQAYNMDNSWQFIGTHEPLESIPPNLQGCWRVGPPTNRQQFGWACTAKTPNFLPKSIIYVFFLSALQDFPVKHVEAFTKSTNPTFNFRFSFTLQLKLGSELHRGIWVHIMPIIHNHPIMYIFKPLGQKYVVQSLFGGVIFECEFNKFIR